jgi:hypothetical protein
LKRQPIYFCQNCHKSLSEVEDLLVIEEEKGNCFCSEDCIIEFHNEHINFFEQEEIEVRHKLNLGTFEPSMKYKNDKELLEDVIKEPDEIWVQENEVGECYYTHIKACKKQKQTFWFILVCFYFEDEPSFIFLQTCTSSKKLLSYYQSDKLYGEQDAEEEEELAEQEAFELSQEVIDTIEQKKSSFLAELLEVRSNDDIAYEKFPKYENNTVSTLEEPDEVFKKKDDEGDTLLTYVKSYQKDKSTFFYIVICLKLEEHEDKTQDVLVPIVSFPSNDDELYLKYAQGERISGHLKN